MQHIETERKFLIMRPTGEDEKSLLAMEGLRRMDMVQTYLHPRGDTERRLRKITENGLVSYVYTEKEHIGTSRISRLEEEHTISAAVYAERMQDCMTELQKTRLAFPYGGHTIEIDLYPPDIGGPALAKRAILEVELTRPDEEIRLPPFLHVLEELTGTRKFSNKKMARPKQPPNPSKASV